MKVSIEFVSDYNKRMLDVNKNYLFRTGGGTLRRSGFVVSNGTAARYFAKKSDADAFALNPVFPEAVEYGTVEGRMNS